MKPLGDFFQRFENLPPSPKAIREVISSVVSGVINYEINEGDIKLDKETVYIKTRPLIKTEIEIKKQAILELLVLKLPKKSITNIR